MEGDREKQTQKLTEEKGTRSGGREKQDRGTEKREECGRGTIKEGEKRGGQKRSENKEKSPRNPEKIETQGNPDGEKQPGFERGGKFLPRPSPPLPSGGPALPCAP